MNLTKLMELLKKHEGFSATAYRDTKGILTIGYGRNLEAMTVTQEQAGMWLAEDSANAIKQAMKFPEFAHCDTHARQNVFVELIYNIGAGKVAKFKKMLAAITAHDWNKAADELYDSKWRIDVGPTRSGTLISMLRTGEFPK